MDKFNGTIYSGKQQAYKSDFWWNDDLFPINDVCNTAINKTYIIIIIIVIPINTILFGYHPLLGLFVMHDYSLYFLVNLLLVF